MPKHTHERSMSLYQGLMTEVKDRLEEVAFRLEVIRQDPKARTSVFEAEFSYLQIRYTCELVALAVLSAHQGYGVNSKLLKEWHADEIFKNLESINPHCFPIPMQPSELPDGSSHLQPINGRYMRRQDLRAVYNACGTALHRGKLASLLKGQQKAYEPSRVRFWLDEFTKLLSLHAVMLPDENRVLVVSLEATRGEPVTVYDLAADGPFDVRIASEAGPSGFAP